MLEEDICKDLVFVSPDRHREEQVDPSLLELLVDEGARHDLEPLEVEPLDDGLGQEGRDVLCGMLRLSKDSPEELIVSHLPPSRLGRVAEHHNGGTHSGCF